MAADRQSPGACLQPDLFVQTEMFSPVDMWTYLWERSLNSEEWASLAATVSDHQRLGPGRLTTLLQALRDAIDEFGGVVRSHHETYALLAKRV